ncbi:MAG: thermonuclease family protein [Candidatus Aenigmatarchaeota archaeon]
MRLAALLVACAILLVGAFFTLSSSGSPTGAAVATSGGEKLIVTKIIDGDTIVVEGGEHVRLLGIDTDEKGQPCFAAAKQRLYDLVLNREVTLEREGDDRDMYDRLLRWIWLDDVNINQQMVAEGLAVARFDQKSKYQEKVAAVEHAAIVNKLGCKWANITR